MRREVGHAEGTVRASVSGGRALIQCRVSARLTSSRNAPLADIGTISADQLEPFALAIDAAEDAQLGEVLDLGQRPFAPRQAFGGLRGGRHELADVFVHGGRIADGGARVEPACGRHVGLRAPHPRQRASPLETRMAGQDRVQGSALVRGA